MAKERTDWDAIEPHYRAGIRALKDIGSEFGVSDAAIIKHARKHEWTRNLKAKIQAKAEAKVSAAVVSAEVREKRALTEAVRVDIEAEILARIQLAQRKDVAHFRKATNDLLEALEADSEHSLKERVAMVKQLTEALRAQVSIERDIYGLTGTIEAAVEAGRIDPIEGARQVAFVLAQAAAALKRKGSA